MSPTAWCLIIDELLRELDEADIYAQAYADNILILVRDDNESVIEGIMQHALALVGNWCQLMALSVNPNKVNVILFTNRYKVKPITGLTLSECGVHLVREAKYLGVIMDSRLNWNRHVT